MQTEYSYEIKSPENPRLEGKVVFQIPTPIYTRFSVGRRMTELVNMGRPANLPLLTTDQVDRTTRHFVEAIANLEHVIKSAPEGFYATTSNGPELRILEITDDNLVLIDQLYGAYLDEREKFLLQRKGAQGNPDGQQRSQVDS